MRRLIILQSCDRHYESMLAITSAVNSAYANRHHYSYRQFVGNLSPIPCTANFNRYYLAKDEILRNTFDWAFWIDADALVVDHQITLSSIIDRTPDKMLIACRGGMKSDFDVNAGVFLLNLRHEKTLELVEYCIGVCESLDPTNSSYRSDQRHMHTWLKSHENAEGQIDIIQRYTGCEHNLFNYDGNFVKHVLREFGDYQERVDELRRIANDVRYEPRI